MKVEWHHTYVTWTTFTKLYTIILNGSLSLTVWISFKKLCKINVLLNFILINYTEFYQKLSRGLPYKRAITDFSSCVFLCFICLDIAAMMIWMQWGPIFHSFLITCSRSLVACCSSFVKLFISLFKITQRLQNSMFSHFNTNPLIVAIIICCINHAM